MPENQLLACKKNKKKNQQTNNQTKKPGWPFIRIKEYINKYLTFFVSILGIFWPQGWL